MLPTDCPHDLSRLSVIKRLMVPRRFFRRRGQAAGRRRRAPRRQAPHKTESTQHIRALDPHPVLAPMEGVPVETSLGAPCIASMKSPGTTARGLCFSAGSRYFNSLLIVADAAYQIAHLGSETHLRDRRLVGTRLRKHVANLGDLTIRLRCCGVQFLAVCRAVCVL